MSIKGGKAFRWSNTLAIALYIWAGIVCSPFPYSEVLSLLYFSTLVFVFLPLSLWWRSTKASYVLLTTYLFPLTYFLFTYPNIASLTIVLTAVFTVPGIIPGLLLMYRGDPYKEKVVHTLGAALTSFDILINLALEVSSGISPLDFILLNSMFITAALYFKGALSSTVGLYGPQYNLHSVTQRSQKRLNRKVATVIFTLPQGCQPIVYVNGNKITPAPYQLGGYVLEIPFNSIITVPPVLCQGMTYAPIVSTIKVTVGNLTVVDYNPVVTTPQPPSKPIPPSPSKVLLKRSLNNWDPQVWVNRKLSVYEVKKVLGEGGNGYVLEGEIEGRDVAIKVLKLYGGTPDEFFDELASEASNLINLSKNNNIVKIYAVDVDSFVIGEILRGKTDLYLTNPPMIVMELMGGGTLKELMEDDRFFYSSRWKRVVLKSVCEVAEALEYIHSQGFVHMDVKPQNVFLDTRPKDPFSADSVHFKLGDLGSAVRANGRVKQVTPEYAPPEVFQTNAKPSFDIFALGMTAYVSLTRNLDRPDLQEINDALDCYIKKDMGCVANMTNLAKTKLAGWAISVDPTIDALIKLMISVDPTKRPTAGEVVRMIRGIDPTIC